MPIPKSPRLYRGTGPSLSRCPLTLEMLGPPPPQPGEENDPFRFGCRYVRRELPDGSEVYDEVPLSWEDLLYPEEEDRVLESPDHFRDLRYCHGALETMHREDPSVVVLGDCRIDFAAAGVRPLGPDVVVLFGVHEWLRQSTFRVAVEGGRPVLAIEVSSPSTRPHDLANKPDLFFRAGVEKYVIIDRGPQGTAPARSALLSARTAEMEAPTGRRAGMVRPVPGASVHWRGG